jgi:hypothetical protein
MKNGHGCAMPVAMGGCQWIPWDSLWVQNLPDPTRVFSLLVIGIVLLRFLMVTNWDFSATISGFFLNPYVLFFFSMASMTAYRGVVVSHNQNTKSTPHLPVYDRWAAEWYWWNAWLYHMTMDGASGSFRLVPVVVNQYDMLDLRFPNRHVVPWCIGVVELFIMGPLCLVTLWAILKRNAMRFPLELVTSSFHLFGMILFVAAEVYEGQLNVPALDPVGVPSDLWANVKLNLYHITYYWFGFWFCNLIWLVVPMLRIRRALDECRFALAAVAVDKKSD